MKKFVTTTVFCIAAVLMARGQLTIEECYERARINYPLVSQYGLINRSEQYNLENARKGYLPQFDLSAQATYQTDVANVGSVFPQELLSSLGDVTLPNIPKDQYKVVAEVQQLVWDGGTVRAAREGILAQGDVDRARYEVDMYALRDRIDNLFFGILLIDEQLKLNEIYLGDLQVNFDRVKSYEENGVANRSDLDAVAVEQVTAAQNRIELQSNRLAYLNMLSAFVGQELGPETELVRPVVDTRSLSPEIHRPEMRLYDAMARQSLAQRRTIAAGNMPKLGLFVQGGYGNPGLNTFKDKFTPWAIGGVRLTWNFGNLYTRRNDMLKIDVAVRQVDIQRETFVFNLRLQERQFDAEVEKYAGILGDDDQIIRMRRDILTASEAKLENGIISVSDLVRDINAYNNARVNKAVHEVQLLKTIYGLKNLTNN